MKNIRFPLEMAEGRKVKELEEFQEYFDLERAIDYFISGKLQKWLEATYDDEILEEINLLFGEEDDFVTKFTEALGIEGDFANINVSKLIYKSKLKDKLKVYVPDEKISWVIDRTAESQAMLEEYVEQGMDEIYLFNGSYYIPTSVSNITFIGIGQVEIEVEADNKVAFKGQKLIFKDVIGKDKKSQKYMQGDTLGDYALDFLDVMESFIEANT